MSQGSFKRLFETETQKCTWLKVGMQKYRAPETVNERGGVAERIAAIFEHPENSTWKVYYLYIYIAYVVIKIHLSFTNAPSNQVRFNFTLLHK